MPDSQTNYVSLIWFDITLLLLAGIAGSIDAIGYLKLGHVLTANMTGNTILLGIAIGRAHLMPAMRSLTALISFIIGAGIGAHIVNRRKRNWQSSMIICMSIELLLIMLMVLVWVVGMNSYHAIVVFASIVLTAVAMGIQSAAIRYFNIPGVVTTYISGTITVIVSEMVKYFRPGMPTIIKPDEAYLSPKLEKRLGLQVLIFIIYGTMAAVTALVYMKGLDFLPILPLILMLSVIIIMLSKRHSKFEI